MSSRENATEWFPSDRTTPFLRRVRTLASELLVHLVEPGETWETDYAGCLLMVDLPEVPDGKWPVITNHIQVRWDDGFLGGYWGDTYLWDDFDERDEEALVVRGVPMTDDEAAEVAVSWLARQLRRPLDHQVWKKGDRVVAEKWVLSDTGREVGRRGGRRASRGSPTSTTRLRPTDAQRPPGGQS
ncbi:hypothetical protein GCM10010531_34690 [Blastococcus jejuensis]|uniref:Uncharacterized protein n=1 Tax=Blastococcus jejuensis TaxID=351224 RepID=A0ABP6PLU8_9ACTN